MSLIKAGCNEKTCWLGLGPDCQTNEMKKLLTLYVVYCKNIYNVEKIYYKGIWWDIFWIVFHLVRIEVPLKM